MATPNQAQFDQLAARHAVVPVREALIADTETPLSAYWKVSQSHQYSFLLESVTGGEQVARYSLIGANPRQILTSAGDSVTVLDTRSGQTSKFTADPLAVLETLVPKLDAKLAEGLPALAGGAVGYLAYDYVRTIERLPDTNPADLDVPDAVFLICDTVVVFDHAKNQVEIVRLTDTTTSTYDEAVAEIEQIKHALLGPLPTLPDDVFPVHPVKCATERADFENTVRTIVDAIGEGQCIQVVPSMRFSTQVEASPVTVYRALRSLNPSPFMFLLRLGELDLVGASPELLVSLSANTARVRPIAGTRPRGQTAEEDNRLAEELLRDEKERAEHIMLVDLGRNDLGKVCVPGSVVVKDMMSVERYSHVMHIVSDVEGTLSPGKSARDLIRATFPAGTLSGAPKVKAMQMIEDLEPTRRGVYGGAVGFFSATGDVDLAIAIRSVVLKDGVGHVQAGAGIVYDSDPASEYTECVNKAAAALRAIAWAQEGLGHGRPQI